MNAGLGITITIVLLLANGFFVAAEFALVSARRSQVEPMARAGLRRGAITLRAMENVSLMMAGAQLGITICSLALGSLSEPVIAHLLEPVFDAVSLPESFVHPVSFVIALLIVTVLHVVIGEMIPKNVALAAPERAAVWLTPPLVLIVRALRPLIWLLNQFANIVLRAVGVTPKDEVTSTFTQDEVAGMVAESHREGLLDAEELELLSGAIEFVDQSAAGVVLPLAEVRTVTREITPDQLEDLAVETGFSRFPVSENGMLTGYLHVKDTLSLPDRGSPVPTDVVRDLPQVPMDVPLQSIFETMRQHGSHLVAATAESGELVGIIAMEDVLEKFVGEVRDVHAAVSSTVGGTVHRSDR